ncbi:MAG: FAD-dependent oxidoreductase [Gemmataceae bacterium]|nr:FAD-dependent oxidoreductase [Gemmataceae bacterium]
MSDPSTPPPTESPVSVQEVHETSCCIVGGGPGGLMLAFFLARQGIPVTLLESHPDFDRDFRGDTVHPATLDLLDELGLADELLKIPHGEIRAFSFYTQQGIVKLADFSGLHTRFPYIATLPQSRFLDFICAEARRFPSFRLVLGANVQRLVQDGDTVKGVQYRDHDNQWHEVRAALTVAADGRFSRIRHLLGLEPVGTSAPMDVLWYRVPRLASDPADVGGYAGPSGLIILLDRGDEWQIGNVIPKDGYKKARAEGLQRLRENVVQTVPFLKDRCNHLQDWKQVTVLSVESNRLTKWHVPGLLLIGDAAHTMSPVGGVGINYAIGDAVEAANVLTDKLKAGRVSVDDLAEVQRRRQMPVRVIQAVQSRIQKLIVAPSLDTSRPFRLPWYVRIIPRLPLLRRLPARIMGYGPRRVHLQHLRASS